MPTTIPCKQCGGLTSVRSGERHHLCGTCNHERRYPPHPVEAFPAIPAPPAPPPSPPLFDRTNTLLSPLSYDQRLTIITLYKEKYSRSTIAYRIPCSLKTVNHWINHYKQHESIGDKPRCGRKRKTNENTDARIIASATQEKFTTPKRIKRQQQLSVSSRTVRRRLNKAGILGRVARKEFPYNTHLRE